MSPLTFLILDDDDDNRFLVRHTLAKAFPGAGIVEAASPDEALTAAQTRPFDAILTDHHLGTTDGAVFIEQLRAAGLACPVVMVTGSNDPAVHQRAYAAGAARVFFGSDLDFVPYFRSTLCH